LRFVLPEVPARRVHRIDLLAVFEHGDVRRDHLLLSVVIQLHAVIAKRVTSDGHLLPRMEQYLLVALIRIACEAEEDQHDANMDESRTLISVDLRHARSGPVPVSTSMTNPIGTIHLLKNGATTVRRLPVTASLSVGNIVANRTKSAENNRIQLLTRNAASRDT